MLDFNELKKFIMDGDINKNIRNDNSREFETSVELLKFTEDKMFLKLNDIKNNNEQQKVINKVLLLLFIQGVKSYKSCLLLCMSGYYTNAMMVLRNVIETIFNIKYILDDPAEIFTRANHYLNDLNAWTKDTIRNKAYVSSNSTLYSLYGVTSDFMHSNYVGTSQNCNKEGYLIAYPTGTGIKKAVPLANAVYYYLIVFMSEHYGINFSQIEEVQKTSEFKEHYKAFKMFNFSRRIY